MAPNSFPTPHPASPSATGSPAWRGDRAAAMAAIWNRHLPSTRERLALLERAASLAAESLLTTPLRTDAAMAAHKLAGSLGTFGFGEGTRIARALEQLLDAPDPPQVPDLRRLTQELRAALPL